MGWWHHIVGSRAEDKEPSFVLLAVVIPFAAIILFAVLRPGPVGWYLIDLNWLWLAYKFKSRNQRIFCLVCFALLTAFLVWVAPYCRGCIGYRGSLSQPDFTDTNLASLHLGGWLPVIIPGAVFFLWRNGKEYRDTGEFNAFTQTALWVVFFGGAWLWVGYFGEHGALVSWPVGVGVLLAVLFFSRVAALNRQRREQADNLREMPPPPDTGGGPAKKSDFEDW